MLRYVTFPFAALLFSGLAQASDGRHHHNHHSPYAGFQEREIKSLSEADMTELRRGGGWGLALPAELNGIPGPAHLLELQEELPLDEAQRAAVRQLFEQMREEAISAGERLIQAELALEQALKGGSIGKAELRQRIAEAEAVRAELRFVHLSRHLDTVTLLSEAQIRRYQALRGYGSAASPCEQVPPGHDPERFRQHMGCE
ncbi:hypothetical protein [Zobellella iuensis]|uniref:Zinc resistance-associated protein n=1 Tax=Zobellella iuensis TaxID=2803811 RepID=A0ABS1QSC4_9GAMM|nr:hypothetical protein [Zobellella iuensis]MBL1377013.1 hypothetical protein [Zobellella iuensis]